MEYLFEFLAELFLEGALEVSRNNKIPRIIRYPLILLIILLFLGVDFLVFFTGLLTYQKINKIAGILLIIMGFVMFFASFIKFRKIYLIEKENKKCIKEF